MEPISGRQRKAKLRTMQAFGVPDNMQTASPTETILNELLDEGPSLDAKITKAMKPKGKK